MDARGPLRLWCELIEGAPSSHRGAGLPRPVRWSVAEIPAPWLLRGPRTQATALQDPEGHVPATSTTNKQRQQQVESNTLGANLPFTVKSKSKEYSQEAVETLQPGALSHKIQSQLVERQGCEEDFLRGVSLETAELPAGQVRAAPQTGLVSRTPPDSSPREPLQLWAGGAASHSQPGPQSGGTGLQRAASASHGVSSEPWVLQTTPGLEGGLCP